MAKRKRLTCNSSVGRKERDKYTRCIFYDLAATLDKEIFKLLRNKYNCTKINTKFSPSCFLICHPQSNSSLSFGDLIVVFCSLHFTWMGLGDETEGAAGGQKPEAPTAGEK